MGHPHNLPAPTKWTGNRRLLLLASINVLLAVLVLLGKPGCHSEQPTAAADIKLFVGVLSRSSNAAVRQAIRDGYGSDPRLVRVMFFVLRPASNHTFAALRAEAAEHEDLVVVSGTQEAYHNTTYSVLEIFRAASMYADSITHLLKTDEDCYVRVGALIDVLAADGRPWLYGGYPMTDQKDNIVVKRDPKHKWYVPYSNWPSDEPVPPYAWGIGAVVSVDLVKHIAAGLVHAISEPDNLMQIEDIAVGIWVDEVLKEQRQQLAKVTLPIDQHRCWNHEVISHLGWLEFVRNDVELAAAHRCMFEHAGACCDKATLLRRLIDQEQAAVAAAGVSDSSSVQGSGAATL